ncbi:cob(I)yrinic acid a,c-diamide adenosyltransferase [Candidatus Saccharibacteria bacterium]|nr:cob(I)yrinic acid a,c-diamide adenosyltransferase [Candidatus Saccharibacteria bacterium]
MPEKGSILVFTGGGKGKTTAAVGQAVRARGRDWRVLMIQFIKKWVSGEVTPLKNLGVEVHPMGLGFVGIMGDRRPRSEHEEAARDALELARKKIDEEIYDLLILDEVNVAISLGLLGTSEVLEFLENKPRNLSVILTGRGAPSEFVEIADLVSEVKEVKHPFQKGARAKKGVEL